MEDKHLILAKTREITKLNKLIVPYCENEADESLFEDLKIKNSLLIERLINKLCLISTDQTVPNIVKNYNGIVAKTDKLLERANRQLDLALNKVSDVTTISLSELKVTQTTEFTKKYLVNKAHLFDFDNSYYPFVPLLTEKINGKYEIDDSVKEAHRLRGANPNKFLKIEWESRKKANSNIQFSNLYAKEIQDAYEEIDSKISSINKRFKAKCSEIRRNALVDDYSIEEFKASFKQSVILNEPLKLAFHESLLENNCDDFSILTTSILPCKPINQTPFFFINTEESFSSMILNLERSSEIAIDIEHHSNESFLGYICLIQISTRTIDYVVDAIALRSIIPLLNKVLSNPRILKVLHGADMDIIWLQQDFGCYIVNMFDTGQAARTLNFPSFSLAYLLKEICDVDADKQYQLSDWRIRPLSAEMMHYARCDTHYLLFIYDKIRERLIDRGILSESDALTTLSKAFDLSANVASKTYSKPQVKSECYYKTISRNCYWSKLQLSVFKLLYKVRDFVARKLDVSPHMTLPNSILFKLVKEINVDKLKGSLKSFIGTQLIDTEFDLLYSLLKVKSGKKQIEERDKKAELKKQENELIAKMTKSMTKLKSSKIAKKAIDLDQTIVGEIGVNLKFESNSLFKEESKESKSDFKFDIFDYFKEQFPDLSLKMKKQKETKKEMVKEKVEKPKKVMFGNDYIDLMDNSKVMMEVGKEEDEEEQMKLKDIDGIEAMKKNTRFLKSFFLT